MKAQRRTEIFSCNNYSHFARDCPFSCTLCEKLGHCRKQCTRNKNEPRMITFTIHNQESFTSNKYSKPEIINGHRVPALLDIRSLSCFLKESVA
ncbi:hypothetical protein NPIL_112911 [Nephila pilipes]|uniref:CCHC-type domain-containing protein n=1 Tax=Nephila pilipes TaxID=299642 RepID=A0A8X6Q5C5_NEPPI|nr:hypothetical protein NPIL_112911 [Nephila pilipes]